MERQGRAKVAELAKVAQESPKMEPRWVKNPSRNPSKNGCILGSILGLDFNGFWEGKRRRVATKINKKPMPTSKRDFLQNRALAVAGARFLRFW